VTSIGFLSTFPPTRCGLATFTSSLCEAMTQTADVTASIVRVMAVDEPSIAPPRCARPVGGNKFIAIPHSIRESSAFL
jgi:hypothetical protein